MAIHINTLYGPVTFNEPVIVDLIASKAIQRLKYIHQYGVLDYIVGPQHFSRYDHSIRVMTLLKYVNAPLLEQIAGLLHDASHTVFSHLADVLFETQGDDSYQDNIHKWYLEHTDIPELLHKHGITLDEVLHKKGTFNALEQDLPALCADRASYIIDGAYVAHKIDINTVQELIKHLRFEDGTWFFDSVEHARMVADLALYLTEDIFATPWNVIMNHWAAKAINCALDKKIITQDDIHFGTDDKIWNILQTSNNPEILENLAKAYNVYNTFSLASSSDFDLCIHAKFRGVDPSIRHNSSLIKLSTFDADFRKKFESARSKIDHGWYVKFMPCDNSTRT